MNAKDLIRAGRLVEARHLLKQQVKSSPEDRGTRTLLFQVLAFCGEWEKAERHLDTISILDSSRETGVQIYKNLIHAEKERLEVFKRERRPSFLPETPPYFELYNTACEKLAAGMIDEAGKIFDGIDAQQPVISGTINGKNFTGFRDTDANLYRFIEAFVHERYMWIPFEAIKELSVPVPKTLFDCIWVSCRLTTWEGLTLNCYLPVLYVASFRDEDERVKLGRMTDWKPLGGGFAKGVGQHVFQVGEEEIAILDIREVFFKYPEKVA
jgi:type VI secretion system protein ImpE